MTCDEPLAAMLDAEPNELEGHGPSALSVHLRACPRCRAVASELLSGTRQLAMAMSSHQAADPFNPIRPAAHASLVRPLAVSGLLAAAVLAIVIVQRTTKVTPRLAPQTVSGAAPAFVGVTPPPGVRATVMQTSNPQITVVWLY